MRAHPHLKFLPWITLTLLIHAGALWGLAQLLRPPVRAPLVALRIAALQLPNVSAGESVDKVGQGALLTALPRPQEVRAPSKANKGQSKVVRPHAPSNAPAEWNQSLLPPKVAVGEAALQSGSAVSAVTQTLTGRVSLHFFLAEIQGSMVREGETELTLESSGDDFQSTWKWTLGAKADEVSSVGSWKGLTQAFDGAGVDATAPQKPMIGEELVSMVWGLRQKLVSAAPTQAGATPSTLTQKVQAQEGGFDVTWSVQAQEELMLPGGRFAAVQVQSQSADARWSPMTLWFAPALNYLPVRIRRTMSDGTVWDALLSKSQV